MSSRHKVYPLPGDNAPGCGGAREPSPWSMSQAPVPLPPAQPCSCPLNRSALQQPGKPKHFQSIRGVWSGHKHGSKARTQGDVLESNTALISSEVGVKSTDRHYGMTCFHPTPSPSPCPPSLFLRVLPSPHGSLTPLSSSSSAPLPAFLPLRTLSLPAAPASVEPSTGWTPLDGSCSHSPRPKASDGSVPSCSWEETGQERD